ncbi:hypothetical protein ACFOU2_14530 [Bacillus songklensis]|uniref:Uncharacterized protein n=1 Tax=Bacillus songklensis TaxID=1069116 RepID=A0ABV8B314_9BACI
MFNIYFGSGNGLPYKINVGVENMNGNNLLRDWSYYTDRLPEFLLALVVLSVGWLTAKAIGNGIEKPLHKTKADNKLFSGLENRKYRPEKISGKVVYYLVLAFVFIIVFNILKAALIFQ